MTAPTNQPTTPASEVLLRPGLSALNRLRLGKTSIIVAAMFTVLGFSPRLFAQTSTEGLSLLQQLSEETQRVYGKARLGTVRVQLPTPHWLEQMNQQQAFLRKWGDRIDPSVRQQIIEQQERMVKQLHLRQGGVAASQPSGLSVGMLPTSQPSFTHPGSSTQPASGKTVDRSEEGKLILVATGLLVDNDGHIVFPLFVDRKDVGDSLLPALTGDGQLTKAKFVGSDQLTNLTVLQLIKTSGQPAMLGHSRPGDGVLTMVVAPDGGARLVIWNNLHPEPGLAWLPDGSIAGFGFDGHFLGASTAKPIVDQLVSTGEVRRATLGVDVQEMPKDDPSRQARTELGIKPAMHVLGVDANSAAARGGVMPDDLILGVDGEAVGDAPTFAAVIATRSGDTVLRVLRGTHEMDLTVTLKPK